jgi:hypothetical protein
MDCSSCCLKRITTYETSIALIWRVSISQISSSHEHFRLSKDSRGLLSPIQEVVRVFPVV